VKVEAGVGAESLIDLIILGAEFRIGFSMPLPD